MEDPGFEARVGPFGAEKTSGSRENVQKKEDLRASGLGGWGARRGNA